MSLIVNEIFHSIQGESLHAGRPCVFIRLTGCNLRCRYCDTAYAYGEGRSESIESIVRHVASFGCNLVEITGGEPLMQGDTPYLVSTLLDHGFTVLMETNGSLDIDLVDRRCVRIVDMKCPSSGESHRNNYENIPRLSSEDQLKFVIGDRADYEFVKHIIIETRPPMDSSHILLSPVTGTLPAARLARWILEDGLNVRLHLQLHKIIWPDTERGV